MKAIDIQARLEYARAAVAVLRALAITDSTMRYKQFARAIGLISDDDDWHAWHRQQIRDILNLVAVTEKQSGANTGLVPLQFERIVNQAGEPGVGFHKVSKIVTG
ncbi:hypothetical protein RB623_03430 [Mesorhizobium sp. LHD-90]|uniref:hypothetical protein n=1 Tax=Mesorhizobium sp. LHD-90 TaxID=3071414 RepID=UPI0027E0BFBF|nr:hypothetical protein [Mesorhizobium sp. LHD-90]MDQ6433101.1 hypothetical protein [Mesorhizobium sp. LHD-90]